jgi:hypothetical protein
MDFYHFDIKSHQLAVDTVENWKKRYISKEINSLFLFTALQDKVQYEMCVAPSSEVNVATM